MPRASLLAPLAVLSLDVTRILVEQGYGLGYDTDAAAVGAPRWSAAYPPLNVIGCTGNGVAIVIETAYPHGVSPRWPGGLSCIIDGVTGNTAANNVSFAAHDVTIGLEQGVLAMPVDATHLALYGQDQVPGSPTVGQLIPLIGNGTWTGGGTVVPALTDGGILIGQDTAREHSAPPRIVLVPQGIPRWTPRTGGNPNPGARVTEVARVRAQRSLQTAHCSYEVRCWGQASPPDPAFDLDATWALAAAVAASSRLLFSAAAVDVDERAGTWDDEKAKATQQIKAGHLLTFPIEISVPVLDYQLPPLPAGTSFVTTGQTLPQGDMGATFTQDIN